MVWIEWWLSGDFHPADVEVLLVYQFAQQIGLFSSISHSGDCIVPVFPAVSATRLDLPTRRFLQPGCFFTRLDLLPCGRANHNYCWWDLQLFCCCRLLIFILPIDPIIELTGCFYLAVFSSSLPAILLWIPSRFANLLFITWLACTRLLAVFSSSLPAILLWILGRFTNLFL